jgi:hypothetical protein
VEHSPSLVIREALFMQDRIWRQRTLKQLLQGYFR